MQQRQEAAYAAEGWDVLSWQGVSSFVGGEGASDEALGEKRSVYEVIIADLEIVELLTGTSVLSHRSQCT